LGEALAATRGLRARVLGWAQRPQGRQLLGEEPARDVVGRLALVLQQELEARRALGARVGRTGAEAGARAWLGALLAKGRRRLMFGPRGGAPSRPGSGPDPGEFDDRGGRRLGGGARSPRGMARQALLAGRLRREQMGSELPAFLPRLRDPCPTLLFEATASSDAGIKKAHSAT
jgi:hypothetical protein